MRDWREINALCDNIIEMIDEDVTEEMHDDDDDGFFENVREKVMSIQETVLKRANANPPKQPTDKQVTALENMKAGVQAWLDRSDG